MTRARLLDRLPASLLALLMAAPLLGAAPAGFLSELEAWRTERDARLRSADGWLSLVGLAWLDEGENTLGSEPNAKVALPQGKTAAHAGTLVRHGDRVRLVPAPGAGLMVGGQPAEPTELLADSDAGGPTAVTAGSVSFFVIHRGDRVGVRIKDSQARTRLEFVGIESFPPDPSWRVVAHFEPYDPPKRIPIPTELGTVDSMVSPGALVFEHGGTKLRLDAVLEEGETDLFLIFGDPTNRKETYGAGRFLYAKPADASGTTVLDFNRAYNPPCAFTPYATCPLPPPQNKLAVRVEAGEKRYAKAMH